MSAFQQYDVMISYSTKRKEAAEDVRDLLMDENFSVWMAPFSIPNGFDYIDEIYSAIDNSSIILFMLCDESLSSDWCKNELIYSAKQNKKILPVQISYVLNPYDKLGGINLNLRRKQILELFPEYKKKLDYVVESVRTLMLAKDIKSNPYPQMSNDGVDDTVVGRDVEIAEIYELLKSNNILNLYGMGGIGKTSVAKKYFDVYSSKGSYQSIHIAKFDTSVKKTIANIPFTGFDEDAFLDTIKDTALLKDEILFEKKMAMLKNHSNEILLVIDNIDYVDQSEVDLLTDLPCQVILTSRNRYENVKSYEIKPLSEEYLIDLFKKISKTELDEENITCLKEIINEVGSHTLTVKLIACYAFDIALSPLELMEEGILNNLKEYDNEQEKISSLLDKCNFSEQEIYALRILALFPHGISKGKFQKIDRSTLRIYPGLVRKGWVMTDDASYQLHQIIRELVIDKFPITTTNIAPFLSRFIEIMKGIGFLNAELLSIMRHTLKVITGDDYLMARMLHLFGNAFCDIGYSQTFHVSEATYENQDMNFYNKKNEALTHFDEFLLSLELNNRALELSSRFTDPEEKKIIPYIYSYLGSTNFNMNNYEKALEYQKKAHEEAKHLLKETDHNYLVILNRIGLTAIEVMDYETALDAFEEYERIGISNDLDLNYAMIKFNIGNVYFKLKDYKRSIENYEKSRELYKGELSTAFGYSELCMALALSYREVGNAIQAADYYKKAREIKVRIITDEEILLAFTKKYDALFGC